MEVVNVQQRKNNFGRFVVLFLILLAIILVVSFMGFNVPVKENVQLKDKMMQQEQEIVFEQSFMQLNNDVVTLLDTLQVAGVNAELLEGRITGKIQQMDALIQQYQGANKAQYMMVVKGLNQHKDDKKTIRLGGTKEQQIAEYEKRIGQLEQNRDEWKAQAEKLQMQIQLLNR